jgi:hypothetical protein
VAGSVAVVVGDPAAGAVCPASFTAKKSSRGSPRTAAAAAVAPFWEPWPAPWLPQPDSPPIAVDGEAGSGVEGARGASGASWTAGSAVEAGVVSETAADPTRVEDRCIEEREDRSVAGA